MRIELNCAECASNNFELGDAQTDDCLVACAECGHVIGTMGQLKERLADEVIRRSRDRRGPM
jgi:uncharacterized Zn finger protein